MMMMMMMMNSINTFIFSIISLKLVFKFSKIRFKIDKIVNIISNDSELSITS
jgi:hypothetical protein